MRACVCVCGGGGGSRGTLRKILGGGGFHYVWSIGMTTSLGGSRALVDNCKTCTSHWGSNVVLHKSVRFDIF